MMNKILNFPLPRVYQDVGKLLVPNKVIAITGPRRSGKTTLIKEYLKTTPYKYSFASGDNIAVHETLGSQDLEILKDYVGSNGLTVIDEAHLIPNIGINLKLMVDNIPGIRILITSSSAFELSNQIGEPLVGRKFVYKLYPLSVLELKKILTKIEISDLLKKLLIFGSYPDVLIAENTESKIRLLDEITNSYLFKDILIFEGLKNSSLLLKLLKLLAFQIGSEVSLTELGNSLDIDKKTVARYLDLLEKAYIIFPLQPYFMNRRKSVIKKNKYYFFDLGVRNTIINNYNPITKRNDVGELWENFLAVERLKKQAYQPIYSGNYFWRTWSQKEIDWVEMRGGKLYGYEFKWNKNQSKNQAAWLKAYPKEALFSLINKTNWQKFAV